MRKGRTEHETDLLGLLEPSYAFIKSDPPANIFPSPLAEVQIFSPLQMHETSVPGWGELNVRQELGKPPRGPFAEAGPHFYYKSGLWGTFQYTQRNVLMQAPPLQRLCLHTL